MNNKYFLGIDLGTTNTVVAIGRKDPITGKIERWTEPIKQIDNLGNITSDKILPSLLYVDDEFTYPGKFAKAKKEQNSQNVICNVKRKMGTDKPILVNNRKFYAYEVSAEYLKACRKSVMDEYLLPFDEVVITVPASYDTEMRGDTKLAAKEAGFKEGSIHIVEEPNAALIDFVYSQAKMHNSGSQIDLADGKRFLVYDIGGGTSDISVIDVQVTNNEINLDEKAKNRYYELGGINFDSRCAEHLLKQIIKDNEIDENTREEMERKLTYFSEYAKESFSKTINKAIENGIDPNTVLKPETRTFENFYNSQNIKVTITYEEYVKYVSSLLYDSGEEDKTNEDIEKNNNIEKHIIETLNKNNISKDSIDYIYLTGGMSNFPPIKERLKSILQAKNDIIVAVNPFESVARGAAIYNYYKVNEKHLNELKANMVSYGKDNNALNNLDENIGEIKIRKMLPESIMVNVLSGLPKVIIRKNKQYPCHEVLVDALKTTSPSGIRLEVYCGLDEYDTNMRIQKIYSKKFDKPVPRGTKIDIECFLDEDSILELKLKVKAESGEQIYKLSKLDIEESGLINNSYNNTFKNPLFYRLNVSETYLKTLENIYKEYADTSDDTSQIFGPYMKFDNIINEMINQGINPIESLLYISKIYNDMLETKYNQESGLSDILTTFVNQIVEKDREFSINVIEHILNKWSWIPQLKIIYNYCSSIKNEELIKKCYESYKKQKLENSELKLVILKTMISSSFSSMISNIFEVISNLEHDNEIDRKIYDYFNSEFLKQYKHEGFDKLYELYEENYSCLPNYSKKLIGNLKKNYEKKYNYNYQTKNINTILENLNSDNPKIRNDAYRDAQDISDKEIVNKIYYKLENDEVKDENVGYAIIALAKSLNKNDYLKDKQQNIKKIFDRYQNKDNQEYLLSCYAAKIISNLYEDEIENYNKKASHEIIELNHDEGDKGYIQYIVRIIKKFEFKHHTNRFINYLIRYIKSAINETNDCKQLKNIIHNYLYIRDYINEQSNDDVILNIRNKTRLIGETEKIYLYIIDFIKYNRNNSNMNKYNDVLFDFVDNPKYSNRVKAKASECLKNTEIKEGMPCE